MGERMRDWRLVGMVISGLLGYDLLNLVNDRPLDINDVLATLIFGGISAVTYAGILARYGHRPG